MPLSFSTQLVILGLDPGIHIPFSLTGSPLEVVLPQKDGDDNVNKKVYIVILRESFRHIATTEERP